MVRLTSLKGVILYPDDNEATLSKTPLFHIILLFICFIFLLGTECQEKIYGPVIQLPTDFTDPVPITHPCHVILAAVLSNTNQYACLKAKH